MIIIITSTGPGAAISAVDLRNRRQHGCRLWLVLPPVGQPDKAVPMNLTVPHLTTSISVAIDARPLSGPPCGYTIYLCAIITCLRSAGARVTLLSNEPLRPVFTEAQGSAFHRFGSRGNIRWEQIDLPAWLASAEVDVYFTGANRGIPWRKRRDVRYVLGLLDVIPYLFWRHYFLSRWRTLLRNPSMNGEIVAQLIAVTRADAILTISCQSAIDIRRLFRRRDVTAHLIRLSDVKHPGPPVAPQPYFVYVGGVDYRKKVDVLLKGFALFAREHPEFRLFLVGSNFPSLDQPLRQLGIDDRVVMTGYVDHDEKFSILRASQAMVYPSLYEGYGLAIAEGFQAGVPVIAGRGGSQAEVGGEAIRPIDPLNAGAIAAAMTEMLDPGARAQWIERGARQLARLTAPEIERATAAYFVEQGRLARRRR